MEHVWILLVATYITKIAGDTQPSVTFSESLKTTPSCEYKNQPTGTPIPTPKCAGFDTCRTFTGWLNGTFTHPFDDHSFVTCIPNDSPDGGTFTCGTCYPPLFYSEKCSSCEWNNDDNLNDCSTTIKPGLVPTTDYKTNFCDSKPKSQNYKDPVNPSYYYACVAKITYHMWCGSNLLYYNSTCDACLSKQ
ncbi:uncharacterized protein LOC101234775 isoform X1 [Hydra vulgaris]|uniref:uncharacterized protein LOC101234775 isoform X1 n=1 Tax=Hydra vulgaris TaxID=6087 RepID=UPI0002B46329|nr:uncharacterized protein LOC101234775 [Hydra vulgaris]